MIDVSGHYRRIRRDIGFENLNVSLEINCCGYQLFDGEDFFRDRPKGRLDFQIIYLHKGRAEFFLNEQIIECGPGNIIIYKPAEIQYYKYFGANFSEDYWVHFTGFDCQKILDESELKGGIIHIGEHEILCRIFKEIMIELQLKKPFYMEIAKAKFLSLLPYIQRFANQQKTAADLDSRFDKLVLELNDSYNKDWDVSKMAALCNMSASHFQHFFKEKNKIPPMRYLIELRLAKAREMMQNSSLNIKQVASLVGYEDPLYFSRLFTKFTGQSPTSFIKKNCI